MEDFFELKKKQIGVCLSDIQKQAVLHTEGALLLLASPGSGKTTTVIMRIGYLIKVKCINPRRIKAVTFSRASASDMQERFNKLFPELPDAQVDFSTIHSLAFSVSRDYLRKTNAKYTVIEGSEEAEKIDCLGQPSQKYRKKTVLKTIFSEVNGRKITDEEYDGLATYISYVKNKMILPDGLPDVACEVPKAREIFQAYEAFKTNPSRELLVDFDDMLTIAYKAFKNDASILRNYQSKYDYVLTDESQDTSIVQHRIIEQLVRSHGNLCVVADEDQSIYSWRGAEPQYLLDFKSVYPHATILMMLQNYRSTQDIVSVSNNFIKRNKSRYDKNMFTTNTMSQSIVMKHFTDYCQQARYIAKELESIGDYREIAVLFRNNNSSVILMDEFDRAGIPIYIKDSEDRFFSHWVVIDIINFMRFSKDTTRIDIFEKIFTKCNLFMIRAQMDDLKRYNNKTSVLLNFEIYIDKKDYQKGLATQSEKHFSAVKQATPLDAIGIIRNELGYEKVLENLSERYGFRKDQLIEILDILEEIAQGIQTNEAFEERLRYLVTLRKEAKFNFGSNAVTFSTLHSSKGLEFERVFMVDLNDGIIPTKDDYESLKAGNPALMEESVRLFYVGMTRAKRNLELLTYDEKFGRSIKPSSFVAAVEIIITPPQSRASAQPDPRAKNTISRISVGRGEMDFIPPQDFENYRYRELVKGLLKYQIDQAGLRQIASILHHRPDLMEQHIRNMVAEAAESMRKTSTDAVTTHWLYYLSKIGARKNEILATEGQKCYRCDIRAREDYESCIMCFKKTLTPVTAEGCPYCLGDKQASYKKCFQCNSAFKSKSYHLDGILACSYKDSTHSDFGFALHSYKGRELKLLPWMSFPLQALCLTYLKAHIRCIKHKYGKIDALVPIPGSAERLLVAEVNSIIPIDALLIDRRRSGHQSDGTASREFDPDRFAVKNGSVPKTILLFDDAHTMGGTANSAAYALKKAGAQKVILLVLCKIKNKNRTFVESQNPNLDYDISKCQLCL